MHPVYLKNVLIRHVAEGKRKWRSSRKGLGDIESSGKSRREEESRVHLRREGKYLKVFEREISIRYFLKRVKFISKGGLCCLIRRVISVLQQF